MSIPPLRRELALALLSLAVMLLQITLTRLLSVLVWYHWAFFAISVSMLGLGVPGVWLALEKDPQRWLHGALLAAGALVPLSVLVMLRLDPSWPFGVRLVIAFACLLPGALALGTAVCVLLLASDGPVGRLYAFDLVGACAGALLAIPLLWTVPAPALAASLGFLPLAATLLLSPRRVVAVAAGIGAVLALLLLAGEPFRVRYDKLHAATSRPIFERWTPTARLTVFDDDSPPEDLHLQWGAGSRAPPVTTTGYWLEQDGSAGTPINQFDGDFSKLDFLLYDVTTAGYQLRHPQRVAIVGGGGGRDILTAKLSGAKDVMAIELNPGIVEALRGPFAAFSGGVYDLDGVETVVGEGRSVLTATPRRFDLIQISLIDSWAATASGAYALSENSLYTVEALRLFLQRLDGRGVLSVSRWEFERARLLLLAEEALRQEGVANPVEHMAMVDAASVTTLLLSPSPLTADDRRRLGEICDERGFVLQLPSDRSPATDILAGGVAAFAGTGLRLDPPTDDRPFFFQVYSPFASIDQADHGFRFNAQAVATLRSLLLALTATSLALFFAPFGFRSLHRGPRFWYGSAYFAAIGAAFMLIENAWLQRFVLYLGHPSRAATAVLGGLLLGAGLGAAAATRLGVPTARRLGWLVPVALVAANLALGPLIGATIGWAGSARAAVVELTLVPAGFLMGFCLPIGLAGFDGESRQWMWAINGFTSVLASVVAVALAMEFGLTATATVGAGLYAVAFALLRVGARPA